MRYNAKRGDKCGKAASSVLRTALRNIGAGGSLCGAYESARSNQGDTDRAWLHVSMEPL